MPNLHCTNSVCIKYNKQLSNQVAILNSLMIKNDLEFIIDIAIVNVRELFENHGRQCARVYAYALAARLDLRISTKFLRACDNQSLL